MNNKTGNKCGTGLDGYLRCRRKNIPWILYAEKKGELTVDDLFKQMNATLGDHRRQGKGLAAPNEVKQGTTPLLNKFNRLLLEDEG
jgi:hypothetical protein